MENNLPWDGKWTFKSWPVTKKNGVRARDEKALPGSCLCHYQAAMPGVDKLPFSVYCGPESNQVVII